jgi:hypothetical protein
MNGPLTATIHENEVSSTLPFPQAINRTVSLLPGENLEEFKAVRDTIIHDVAPRSGIEWLWTIDFIELSWDIRRYRALRHKVLETHRQRAVEQILRRVDCSGIPAASQEQAADTHNETPNNSKTILKPRWRSRLVLHCMVSIPVRSTLR